MNGTGSPRGTIGILGAGRVGSALARAALAAGFDVRVAGSGAAEDIALLVEVVIPGAQATTATDAVVDADIVIVAVPLHRALTLDPTLLDAQLVIDVTNHWAPVDGALAEVDADPRGTSEILAARHPGARIVKTINHIGYHELELDARPHGTADRRALAVAGDNRGDVATIAAFIDLIGFDPVPLRDLAAGRELQPGEAVFGRHHTAASLRELLGDAVARDTAALVS